MSRATRNYLICGHRFNKIGLRSFCVEKISVLGTPLWEREIWTFILEWLSAEESIEVQTSGSTGKPKTISILKKHMESSAKATLGFFSLKRGDTAMLCLPTKYIAGKMMVVRALVGGLDLHFTEPSSHPNLSKVNSIAFSAMVPMQVASLLETKEGMREINKIRDLLIGGSFLPHGLEKKLNAISTNVWQSYGMTETITHIALRKLNGTNATEWYKPLDGVDLGIDEKGCVQITANHLGVEGLATNDLAKINQNGEFKILGRDDHVVISGGIKLHPEAIEHRLQGFIKNNFILAGQPHDKLGEQLVMIVEGEETESFKENDIWKIIKRELTTYENPKEIFFIPKFARTENGKVNRKETVKLI